MDVVDQPVLRAVLLYESRHRTGPTVRELAENLGIPAEFGHRNLVGRLQREVKLEHLAHYRGRFTVTATGRLALEAVASCSEPAEAVHPAERSPSVEEL